jgi:hypothetical protein
MSISRSTIMGTVLLVSVFGPALGQTAKSADSKSIERGRYLVKITGCNDCHTPGYALSGGKVPEKQWLTGDSIGWQGPWGTTYPSNLRLYMQKLSEDDWVKLAKTLQLRPPMPWFALHDMTRDDLRAIYRFTRFLGAAGEPAPSYLPPGQNPKGPFIQFPQPPK